MIETHAVSLGVSVFVMCQPGCNMWNVIERDQQCPIWMHLRRSRIEAVQYSLSISNNTLKEGTLLRYQGFT